VIGLTKSAALEYAPRGIRINAVCPGTIRTPMVTDMIAKGELDIPEAEANQPIGRLGRGEEIAAAVLWLCSPGGEFRARRRTARGRRLHRPLTHDEENHDDNKQLQPSAVTPSVPPPRARTTATSASGTASFVSVNSTAQRTQSSARAGTSASRSARQNDASPASPAAAAPLHLVDEGHTMS
jgi:hypothetical protein